MIPFSFFFSVSLLFLEGIFIPKLSLFAFAPFLALIILKEPFMKTLLWAAFSGAIVDLFSDDPFGGFALNFCFIAFVLWQGKRFFSHENPFHWSFFTALVSLLVTLFQIFLLFLFDRRIPIEREYLLSQLLGMPALDALYALVCFAIPYAVFKKIKRWWLPFWLEKKQIFRLLR